MFNDCVCVCVQALETIKQLRSVEDFQIAPAMMEVVISVDADVVDRVQSTILSFAVNVLRQGVSTTSGSHDFVSFNTYFQLLSVW